MLTGWSGCVCLCAEVVLWSTEANSQKPWFSFTPNPESGPLKPSAPPHTHLHCPCGLLSAHYCCNLSAVVLIYDLIPVKSCYYNKWTIKLQCNGKNKQTNTQHGRHNTSCNSKSDGAALCGYQNHFLQNRMLNIAQQILTFLQKTTNIRLNSI